MAEWLRRLTRNQMGSSRVGSNPTRSELSNEKSSSSGRPNFEAHYGSTYVLTANPSRSVPSVTKS